MYIVYFNRINVVRNTAAMGRHCCVPGCHSNYTLKGQPTEFVSTFSILKECKDDSEKLQLWLRRISRQDMKLTSDTVICVKHFVDRFVIRHDTVKRADGTLLTCARKIPKLTKDAYPSVFTDCTDTPSYMSSEPPAKRRAPEDRLTEQLQRDEAQFAQWMKDDRISSFNQLCENADSRLSQPVWRTFHNDVCFMFYLLRVELSCAPCVTVSVCVLTDLSVHVYRDGLRMNQSKLDWVLAPSGKLDCWSKLESLLSHVQSSSASDKNFSDKICDIVMLLNQLHDNNNVACDRGDNDDDVDDDKDFAKNVRVVKVVTEQLQLLVQSKPKYSADFLHWAFEIFSLSPATYELLRDSSLMLPHPTYLRTLSSCLKVEPGMQCNAHVAYLTQKAQLLQPHERDVSLLLDEIYVNPKVGYKAGTLEGFATNCDMTQATTVQAFMITSVLSNNKDVAALVPVKNLTACFLKELTLQVISMVEKAGFRVLCVISDNNKVNGNMFGSLCGGDIRSSIAHPLDSGRRLFFFFDSVHLMKCVRNNWINQKDVEQTIAFPDFLNGEKVCKARFKILKDLYKSEKNSVVKLAPSLNQRALNPSSTDRQSVPLMMRVFNDKVVVALQLFSERATCPKEWVMDAKALVEVFVNLWKILNVKHPLKGRNLRDVFCDPVRKADDLQVSYIQHVVQWLEYWETLNPDSRHGMLSKETSFALRHTLKTYVALIEYLFERVHVKYVLLGKFQTDYLEYRFSQYRRLAGTNFHISVREVLESEKKLKLVSLLKLNSSKLGQISIAKFVADCTDAGVSQDDTVSELSDEQCMISCNFVDVISDCDSVTVTSNEIQILIFLGGYIGKKFKKSVACDSCVNELVSKDRMPYDAKNTNFAYLEALDRGGLTLPTQILVDVLVVVFRVFQCLISCKHEKQFTTIRNQKQVIFHLSTEKLRLNPVTGGACTTCGKKIMDNLRFCVTRMANVLLNNYSKQLNDKIAVEKGMKTKETRKLATFSK